MVRLFLSMVLAAPYCRSASRLALPVMLLEERLSQGLYQASAIHKLGIVIRKIRLGKLFRQQGVGRPPQGMFIAAVNHPARAKRLGSLVVFVLVESGVHTVGGISRGHL